MESRTSVVAVQLEGRGKDQRGVREWLGAGLRSYFTSTLVVCNTKLSIPLSVYVGALSGQLSPRERSGERLVWHSASLTSAHVC